MAIDEAIFTALRTEIVEAQKTQAEFLKWKLIAAASVAAVGLGYAAADGGAQLRTRLLICLIPLICAYVDLLSLHIVVRIIVIASFLRQNGDAYETFVHSVRSRSANPFRFELMALHGSSFVINFVIALVGAWGVFAEWKEALAYVGSGLAGATATFLLWRVFVRRVRELSALASSAA